MLPTKHAILGFVFTLIVYWINPDVGLINMAVLFLSTFLIDADHYLYYIYKKRDFSLKRAYNYNLKDHAAELSKEKLPLPFMFFHTIEFLIILALLSTVWDTLFYVTLGFVFHIALDIYDVVVKGMPRARELSIIAYFMKKKSMR